jgi:hypothetical protein
VRRADYFLAFEISRGFFIGGGLNLSFLARDLNILMLDIESQPVEYTHTYVRDPYQCELGYHVSASVVEKQVEPRNE